MTPALLSVVALLVAIALSMTTRLNVGLAAIVFSWLVGVYAAGLSADAVMRGSVAECTRSSPLECTCQMWRFAPNRLVMSNAVVKVRACTS